MVENDNVVSPKCLHLPALHTTCLKVVENEVNVIVSLVQLRSSAEIQDAVYSDLKYFVHTMHYCECACACDSGRVGRLHKRYVRYLVLCSPILMCVRVCATTCHSQTRSASLLYWHHTDYFI